MHLILIIHYIIETGNKQRQKNKNQEMILLSYDDLLIESTKEGLIVREAPLTSADGRIDGENIFIRQNINTTTEKACILAEEMGHHYTAAGNILDQTQTSNRKQEQAGRLWAYNKQIGLAGIVQGFKRRCQNRHELAEYLQVSESFLQEALECYRKKYGNCAEIDNYTIIFEPSLTVIEKI